MPIKKRISEVLTKNVCVELKAIYFSTFCDLKFKLLYKNITMIFYFMYEILERIFKVFLFKAISITSSHCSIFFTLRCTSYPFRTLQKKKKIININTRINSVPNNHSVFSPKTRVNTSQDLLGRPPIVEIPPTGLGPTCKQLALILQPTN